VGVGTCPIGIRECIKDRGHDWGIALEKVRKQGCFSRTMKISLSKLSAHLSE